MNNVLQLRGTFQQRPSSGRPGSPNIPKKTGSSVSSSHLKKLTQELNDLATYWKKETVIPNVLIDVNYINVIAKSNRISGFFNKGKRPNDSIVGARFNNGDPKKPKHIITHYISRDVLQDTIKKIENSIKIIDTEFGGNISYDEIKNIDHKKINFNNYKISKSVFLDIIVDSYYVEGFDYPKYSTNATDQQIITIYKTNKDTSEILKSIGIVITPGKILSDSDTTILLQPDEVKILQNKAPYLISMALDDITKLSLDDIVKSNIKNNTPKNSKSSAVISSPKNEPCIGVIDTLFDSNVYFNEWVDYYDMVPSEIPKTQKDYRHGTAVSSIIVDGHKLNPTLDDGCGYFRVRHFGVAVGGKYSSFTIIKLIQQIVANNRDIKVWNLSLGSTQEVNGNFISPEAAALDKIQFDNDVIFVIAGTNKPNGRNDEMLIGAPADSINSMVVNSVNKNNEPASYSRKGRVLSFFNKPDVSAFGGDGVDYKDNICVYTSSGTCEFLPGTSFAAPWISRKLAYLIEVIGLSREVAKALIVDAATGWNDTGNNQDLAPFIGHGAVPISIDDIVTTKDGEIKFIMSGMSEQYDTYAYNIPVPVSKGVHPFVTKATLCYFPKCSINQGVDYTNTELDISIGRIDAKETIKPINRNVQNIDGYWTPESDARKLFRKWDNTKHIREKYGESLRARKAYDSGRWGVSVKTKERLEKRDGYGIKFGLIVTLKEINDINRIHDFKQKALAAGWRVEEISVRAKVDIYNKLQEEITFR